MRITNKRIRDEINKAFFRMRKLNKGAYKKFMKLSVLDKWVKDVYEIQQHNRSKISKENSKYIEVSYLGILSLGLFSIAIGPEIKKRFNKRNFIISNLLANLTNHALGVLELCILGLETSADTLLRTTIETNNLLHVLCRDKNLMKLYYSSNNEDGKAFEIWKKNFKPSKILKILHRLEMEGGMDEIEANELKKEREERYNYYSQSTHANFISAMIKIRGATHAKKENLNFNVFGGKSFRYKSLLGNLLYTIWHCHLMLQFTFNKERRDNILKKEDEIWIVYELCKDLFLNLYPKKFKEILSK